ncbi:hypothetical protein [Enterococcus avium]|uniref:hypothetical protein n=1 Tax=Enterococcus avium TaxID=33945 RepID=UPI00232AC24D|nr:hypothetical protein [Enterococcus avium]MDB1727276.1 hypothetical protein [Enterococcus avium]MDB1731364.1 hypothetical protein [Enterococcus avium]
MTAKFDFKKQKIRGWKRRLRDVEYWVMNNKDIDLGWLEERNMNYSKLWIHPFFSLKEYTLPNWYKRLLIQALLDVYHSWETALQEIGEPYYLKIWIFKKDFMRSQVVASYRDSLHNYDNLFSEVKEVVTLPSEMKVEPADQLIWNQGIFLVPWSKQEMLEDLKAELMTLKEITQIIDSAYTIEENSDDTFYYVEDDTVWIGG